MMLEDLYRILKSSHIQAQGVVDTLSQPLLVLDRGFCVVTANNAFVRTFKVDRDELVDRSIFSLGNGQWDIPDLRTLFDNILPKSTAVIGYEVTHDFPVIGKHTFLIDAQRLVHPDNNSMNILVQFEDITEKKRQEAERDFVVAETRHRMRNVASIMRAIAFQTETENRTAEEYREALLGRLDAAMSAQEISFDVRHTQFSTLLEKATASVGMDRIHIEKGPSAQLSRSKMLPVILMFHELTTNALKYGSLSVPDGVVRISWRVDTSEGKRPMIICEWREENGPPCKTPEKRGYGTELIDGTATHMGGAARLDFEPGGLVAVLTLPIESVGLDEISSA